MLLCKRFVSLAENLRRMGRRNKNVNKFAQRKRDRKEKEQNGETAPTSDTRKHYEEIAKENAAFEEYYKAQKVCPESEWDIFMKSLRESLPTAFRITGSRTEAHALLDVVQGQYFSEILNTNASGDGADEIKPVPLSWYPGGLAWQLRLSRTDIRRSEPLYRLHNFLVAETAAGGVSRQEAVSMLPPVVLDVKPHHKVLDMCAAPGSKTAQLIEFLHADEDKMPTGFVMANDVDNSRCYMLVHQAKRLNSPCILISNQDSAFMPNLKLSRPGATDSKDTVQLKFDRVLCDVPCSGDATLRKNPDIWLKWSPGNGNNLHGIQYRILKRGSELLAVGGRVVYSTCSFNPVENEAVVHRLLQESGGALVLVDVGPSLPGLKYNKGMTHWRPGSKDMVFYDKYEDVPEKWQTVVRPQMFPPQPEDLHKYSLDKCIRILPHQQDTGGFFVAVLEKRSPLPWEKIEPEPVAPQATTQEKNGESVVNKDEKNGNRNEATENKDEVNSDKCDITGEKDEITRNKDGILASKDSATGSKSETPERRTEPPKKRRRMGGYREDPFVFFSGPKEDVFPSIKEFYQLSDDFDPTCLLTRCYVGKKKNIYLVSPTVKDLVIRNEDHVKIINTGVKTFVRCDNKNMTCAFRLSQEGLMSIASYIGAARRVRVLKEDLVLVLQNDNPSAPPELTRFSSHTQALVENLAPGSCVLEYSCEDSELKLTLVGWRGVKSLRAYTATSDTVHYLRLLGADISKYDVNKFKKAAEEASDGNKEDSAVADVETAEADAGESSTSK